MITSVIGSDDLGRQTLEQQLAVWWTAALGINAIGVDDDVFQLGCDPDRGAMILDRIRRELQIEIPVSDLFEARTIAKLADLIEIRQASMDFLSVIPIRKGSGKQPLILIHGVGGNLLGFVSLVRLLDADQTVYGIQAQALQDTGPVLIQLEAMAAYYIRELRAIQPEGPYNFLGLSFGGLVACEMAQQLVASGESVNLLGMLDTWQPGYMRELRADTSLSVRILHRLHMVRLNTRKLSMRQTFRYTLGRMKGRVLRLMYLRIGKTKGVSLPGSMRRVRDINLMAGARYVVKAYPGRITLFRALDEFRSKLPEDLGWRTYARGGVEIVQLPGDHGQILSETNAIYLAKKLTADLAASTEHPQHELSTSRTDFELNENEWIESCPEEGELSPLEGTILADHETEAAAPRASSPSTWLADPSTQQHARGW